MNGLNFYWILLAGNPFLVLALVLLVRADTRLCVLAARLVRGSDWISEKLIEGVKWFALLMVLLTAALVIGRYVFGIGSLKGQELVIYLHALLFLFAGGATLLHEGHVRVDVLYSKCTKRGKAWVDVLGGFVFLVPVCLCILIFSQSYIALSWQVHEGSPEADGLAFVYLLKTAISVFAGVMLLQGSAQTLRAALVLTGRPLPGAKPHQEPI